jgi:hypothetical protein
MPDLDKGMKGSMICLLKVFTWLAKSTQMDSLLMLGSSVFDIRVHPGETPRHATDTLTMSNLLEIGSRIRCLITPTYFHFWREHCSYFMKIYQKFRITEIFPCIACTVCKMEGRASKETTCFQQAFRLSRVGLHAGTLPSQWFLTPARLYAYQPLLQIVQIPDVSSKDGTVIGAVFGTRKFHRGHLWHQTQSINFILYKIIYHDYCR